MRYKDVPDYRLEPIEDLPFDEDFERDEFWYGDRFYGLEWEPEHELE